MLALMLLPALLGIAFMVDTQEDIDTDDFSQDALQPDAPDPAPPQTDLAPTTEVPTGTQDIEATSPPDATIGSDTADRISGQDGNDLLQGFGDNDTIGGDAGNDTIFAGDGDDFAVGGRGDDRVFLGAGDDIYSPEDDPSFDDGDDLVRGGAGDDGIVDLNGSDTIFGDAGNDVIATFSDGQSADAPDTIDGGSGEDTLFGDNGDVMIGGADADIFAVIKPVNHATAAVTINDFDVDEDMLTLFVAQADAFGEEAEFRADSATNALRVFWRGDEVAVLTGVSGADTARVDVTIIDAADLQRAGFG